jgi:epoxide hydrolase-like predicted phosphatase
MIKFVYLDVGGVVIKDFSGTNKWEVMKKAMGVKKEFDKEFDRLFDQYELKELCLTRDVDSLIPIFTKKFGMNFPNGFSMLGYFVDHFEQNRPIWSILKRMKKTCRLGLLTNMYVGMFDEINKRGLLPPIKWNVVIDSTKVGLQKPDPKIFVLAREKSGVNNEEILFVDNNQKNIETASKFGWQTFFYDSSKHEESCKRLNQFLLDTQPFLFHNTES